MQKQVTQFKTVIQEMETIFLFDPSCSTAIAKESLLECLKWIGQVEDVAKAQQKIQENAEATISEAPVEQNQQEPLNEQPSTI